ncbi:MAG TPA: glycine--tRNA ligase subunit beta [Syntrophomonadaceae bacterium]|nr:glycine--tRNA ligase subunit beta [Syntrophomonadaceae bacterium]
MQDLLLEIGVEEIPSAYMPGALQALADLAGQKINEARLPYSKITVYGTPRRLVLFVQGLAEAQEDAAIENRGPKKSIAIDPQGQPTKAGLGFARGQGMDFSELVIQGVEGIEYLFALKRDKGKESRKLLPDLLQSLIQALPFPKSMRWAYFNTRFARPIRWLLALYGDQPLDLQIENIKSSPVTYGHRFLSNGPQPVKDIQHYFALLEEHFVILDQDRRQALIWDQVRQAAAAAGGEPMENPDLLEEVAFLVEYPTAFYGAFSSSYLTVPPEVLTTSMIEHQRYFPVFSPEGHLLPGFIAVRNGTDYNLDEVRAGNQRVLKARLEDALFFWNEDTKEPLEQMAGGLKNVLFHERLGSLQDKVERLKKLAVFLGATMGMSDKNRLERAAGLCKADLLSAMVYEFPELQGIMGRYYALQHGEETELAEAILEHYLPRFAADELPATGTGISLSLAEKLDNLVGCFAIGIKPSGSQDPYALRRQALGIVNIILGRSLDLDLKECIAAAYDNFSAIQPENSREDTTREVLDFILQRLRGVLLDRGFSYDVIDAVLQRALRDVRDVYVRVKTVQDFKQSTRLQDFMVVYNRAHNLSRKWESPLIDETVLEDPSEIELNRTFQSLKKDVTDSLDKALYSQALEKLSTLRPAVDLFFNSVMVMVENQELKAARLGLLKSIAELCNQVADFGKLVF